MHSHTDSSPASPCPLCDEATDRRILKKGVLLERRVARRLREHHPEWNSERGACIRCVAWALADLVEFEHAPQHIQSRKHAPRPWPRVDPLAEPVSPADAGVVPEGIGRHREILSLQARLHPDLNYSGRGVTVAIVDSDFVYHPDFTHPRNRVAAYVNASITTPRETPRPPNPYIASWHGTMVTGAGFGSGWSAGGRFRGLAPDARLVFVRIADERVHIGETEVLRGLRWVVQNAEKHHIKIVNLSVGGDEPAPSSKNRLDRLAARAVRAGLTLVAAAGNRADRKPVAPASAPEVITVGGFNDLGGAISEGDPHLFPGAHGPTLDLLQKPDVLAPAIWVPAPMVPDTPQAREAELLYDLEALPGELLKKEIAKRFAELSLPADIILRPEAAIRRELIERARQQKFITPFHQHVDGTSFAASIVSAVAAQMLEANPGLTPADIKNILRETAQPLRGVAPEIQGAGVVRPALAVRIALELRAGRIPELHSPSVDGDLVRYFYFDPTEKLTSVEWLGSLNNWKPLSMIRVAPSLWMLERPRPAAGRYLYKYLLSDGRWVSDPANDHREPDGYGDWNSVFIARR